MGRVLGELSLHFQVLEDQLLPLSIEHEGVTMNWQLPLPISALSLRTVRRKESGQLYVAVYDKLVAVVGDLEVVEKEYL